MVKQSLCLLTRKHSATLAESDRKGHRFKGQIEWIDAVLKMLAWTGKSFEIWPVIPVCMCVSISGVCVLSILRRCACAMITPDPLERNPSNLGCFLQLWIPDSQDKTIRITKDDKPPEVLTKDKPSRASYRAIPRNGPPTGKFRPSRPTHRANQANEWMIPMDGWWNPH